MTQHANRRQTGFTLVELIVVMLLIAILTGLALPSFTATITRNRIAAQTNEVMAAINYARSLAIQFNAQAGVCAANDGQTACGGDWANGILVWVDADRSGGFTAGEVRRAARLDQADLLAGGLEVIFNNRGQRVTPPAGAFELTLRPGYCESGDEYQRRIQVSLSGVSSVSKEACA